MNWGTITNYQFRGREDEEGGDKGDKEDKEDKTSYGYSI
jgi:hypothetical protein